MKKSIYFNHDDHLRLEENTVISSKRSCLDYIHGHCHLFCLALLEYMSENNQVAHCELYWDHNALSEGHGALLHVYACINNNYLDARGVIDLEDLAVYESQSSYETETFRLTLNELKIWCKNYEFNSFLPNEKSEIKSFISNNRDLYLIEG